VIDPEEEKKVYYPIKLDAFDPDAERMIKICERMKSEIQMAQSQTQFRLTTSSMGNTSIQSQSDALNRSGASFYTMPEADMDLLLKENIEIASQISDLETLLGEEGKGEFSFMDEEAL